MTTTTPFDLRYALAQGRFERADYIGAATALRELVDEVRSEEILHASTDLRLLLARAYYHSAQLGRAEAVLRELTDELPTDAYAHLLLGRTLERAGRPDDAKRPLALAALLGAPGTD